MARRKDIGVICATIEEAQALCNVLTSVKVDIVSDNHLYICGTINQILVHIIICGIGSGRTFTCTKLICELSNSSYLVFFGTAGGVSKKAQTTMTVVATENNMYKQVDNRYIRLQEIKPTVNIEKAIKRCSHSFKESLLLGNVLLVEKYYEPSDKKRIKCNEVICVNMEAYHVAYSAIQNGKSFVALLCITDSIEGTFSDHVNLQKAALLLSANVFREFCMALYS